MHNSFVRLLSSIIIACLLFIFIGWSTVSAFFTDAEPQSIILYVKPGANGTCFSWADACSLQTALYNAVAGDQIWVAAGTYKPSSFNRSATFQLKTGVAIYGGFPAAGGGWETRDWVTNITTLSGEIGILNDSADNSYHVVTGSEVDATAVFDGFTISFGNANGYSSNYEGGGMVNYSGSPSMSNIIFSSNTATYYGGGMFNSSSSPSLTNVTFSNNSTTSDSGYGGGMYSELGSPSLSNVTFNGNAATYYGGGMYNLVSTPNLSNVTFINNSATGNSAYGGGMYNWNSSPSLTNVTFSGNTATISGGGMFNNNNSSPSLTDVTFSNNSSTGDSGHGGGMCNYSSSPTLNNVTFNGNSGSNGGGMFNSSSSPSLNNVSFAANTATNQGGGMFNYTNSSPSLANVTFSSNLATWYGGGMTNQDSSPSLANVTFSTNTAVSGGGMFNAYSSPSLTNVTFSGNSATNSGGGMDNGVSSPSLTNVTFSSNTANRGGGMSNQNSSPSLTNVTFNSNTATEYGGGIDNLVSSPSLTNSILWGNTPDQVYGDGIFATYSDIQGGYPGTGNIDVDPMLGPLAANGGFTQTQALSEGSPAIDVGDPANCPTVDQRGYARPIDGDGNGTATCDMGAYEYASYPVTYSLTIDMIGNGLVTKDPNQTEYLWGEYITLTPVADPDWIFIGWSGDVSSMDNPLTFTIFEDTNITANFRFDAWTLTTSVFPEGSGSVAADPDQPTYHNGDQVTLTAIPNPGWSFAGWTGDASGTISQIIVTMTDNLEITANFAQSEYTLSVSVDPPGMGTVAKSPNKPYYYYGEVVTLTASSSVTGWRFVNWTGHASGATNPIQVTITGDAQITANFSDRYSLEVIAEPPGSGYITKIPDQATYDYGTQVTLTANAYFPWTFVGWSGDASGTDNPVIVTILGDTAITATFTQDEYTLAVTPFGSGTVTIDPIQDTYHFGDVVTLAPTADPGWAFTGWGGDASGSDNPLTYTIVGDTTITATFTQDEYTLTVTPVGSGTVAVDPEHETYHYGDEVTLAPLAIPGWSFLEWGGDASGTDNPLDITILGDTNITATFTQDYYTLSVTPIGAGLVGIDPLQETYTFGTNVTLTATADLSWNFLGWGGDAGGSINPLVVTISGNTNITALFTTNSIFLPMITR